MTPSNQDTNQPPHATRDLAELARVADRGVQAAALAYAALGWPVLPIAGMVGSHCGCRKGPDCTHPAKHPLIRAGTRGATIDAEIIQGWFAAWPWAGVGIVTGARSSLVVLDVDPRHDGDETLDQLLANGLSLPPTLMAHTGGGGRHYFFDAGALWAAANTSGRLPNLGATPGLDLRGEGGYVVAAPSRHASGGTYRWTTSDSGLAPLPDVLHPRRRANLETSFPRTTASRRDNYVRAAMKQEQQRVLDAPVGTRNDALNRSSFALGTLVGAGACSADMVTDLLTAAATAAGIPEREAARTIRSGLQAGIARPRHVPDETVRPTK